MYKIYNLYLSNNLTRKRSEHNIGNDLKTLTSKIIIKTINKKYKVAKITFYDG